MVGSLPSALDGGFTGARACCCCSLPSSATSPSMVQLPLMRSSRVQSFPGRSRMWVCSPRKCHSRKVMALVVDPSDSARGSVEDFVARMEKTWLISKQPRPVSCTACNAEGRTECPWCKGTGFFILGDNLLCEVPSRNTTCLICSGQGAVQCKDCKGTGYRARWMDSPSKIKGSGDSLR